MTDIAALGHLTLDVVADAAPRPGGGVFFAARALSRLGADARIAGHDVFDLHDVLPYAAGFAALTASWISTFLTFASTAAGSGTLTSSTPSLNVAFTSSTFAPSGRGTER